MPVVLVALGSLLACTASAQTAPSPASSAPAPAESESTLPVLVVTSVEVLRTARPPAVDIVVAQGLTTTGGWSDGTLLPLTDSPPADGVLDVVFVAQPPSKAAGAGRHEPIQALLPLSADHPFNAIRVRSATNAIVLRKFPGFTEASPSVVVCGACVGKLLLAKGATPPAGVAADQIVREEDLPARTRIIRPEDGISDMRANPNRLTVVLGENGRILSAGWE
jgi:hypothetical protein